MDRGRLHPLGSISVTVIIGALFVIFFSAERAAAWPVTVRYSFSGGVDGSGPTGVLAGDKQGSLYGTTNGEMREAE